MKPKFQVGDLVTVSATKDLFFISVGRLTNYNLGMVIKVQILLWGNKKKPIYGIHWIKCNNIILPFSIKNSSGIKFYSDSRLEKVENNK